MKLFYKPGACSLGAHIILRELNEPIELEKTDTDTGVTANGTDYAVINPNGFVPALKLANGDVLTENVAVLTYLSELRPSGPLAIENTPMARVRHTETLSYLSSELHKAFSPFFSGQAETAAAREAALGKLRKKIATIERQLSNGRRHLLGDQFTPADAYAFAILNWAGFIRLDLAPWPRTAAFVERIRARPSVQQAMVAEGLIAEAAA